MKQNTLSLQWSVQIFFSISKIFQKSDRGLGATASVEEGLWSTGGLIKTKLTNLKSPADTCDLQKPKLMALAINFTKT